MDKYEELIAVFSETLEQSRDYHIAYMYQVGYVSVLGLYERDSTQNNSMKIDEVFHSPEEMADSLLRNWRWQWFYKNRKLLGCQDFENICNLDNKIPDLLQEEYRQSIQILQNTYCFTGGKLRLFISNVSDKRGYTYKSKYNCLKKQISCISGYGENNCKQKTE